MIRTLDFMQCRYKVSASSTKRWHTLEVLAVKREVHLRLIYFEDGKARGIAILKQDVESQDAGVEFKGTFDVRHRNRGRDAQIAGTMRR